MNKIMLSTLLICLLSAPDVTAQGSTAANHLKKADTKIHSLTEHSTDQPRVRIEKHGELTFVVGSILINAPREKVWETLVDYEKSPELFKNLSLCKVIGTEGEVKLLRQLVKPGGPIKFDYIVRLTETKPSLIKWSRKSGSFKEVMGSWELESVPKSTSTSVVYSIHLDGGFALPPWLLASQIKGYLPKMLNALKVKLESTHQGIKS